MGRAVRRDLEVIQAGNHFRNAGERFAGFEGSARIVLEKQKRLLDEAVKVGGKQRGG